MSGKSERVAETIRQLNGQAARLLGFMADGKWHSQHELQTWGGQRWTARLFDLKQRGHAWEKRCVRSRQFEYRMLPKQDLFGDLK
jgi:hypothetical protein